MTSEARNILAPKTSAEKVVDRGRPRSNSLDLSRAVITVDHDPVACHRRSLIAGVLA